MSVACGEAIDTVANELPPRPTVEVGLREIAVGATAGRSVTGADTAVPVHVAVTVAVVVAATLFVWSGNDTEKLPGSTKTDGGGVTAGELLDSATIAPPGGAWPESITIAPGCAPPVMDEGEIVTDVSTETDDVKISKPPRVVPAGTIMPFGTDATAGLLLVT